MAKALVTNQVFGGNLLSSKENCRYFRIEVRTANGGRRFYALKARKESEARLEAVKLITDMVNTFQDEKIAWRMAGDKNWTFGTHSFEARIAKKSWFNRFAYYFFALD
ncbi:DUF6018 family natural product bioysynthesis protein [Cytobacillus gottheilii]|uniref:DUF6018 family natural product bioysynthesis protein n=1 Tax=Cytobacillus gottheilii TaxID=859144 RepID=UPI0024950F05|nr:DUF6018 family natural product bioysynthesis protein [Cytobacillus gottheilii]